MQSRAPGLPPGGVYAALATPRKPECVDADAAALLDYIDKIATAGVNGLVLFGSTGEFVHYDLEDRKRVLALAVKRSRVPLLVNVSHSSFPAAVDLAENAVESGAAGVLLMPPYFFHYSEAQLFAFYEQFAKTLAGATPIYLYNIPAFTTPISAALAQQLLLTRLFSGIKDSSGDWSLFESLEALHKTVPFCLLAGNDRIYSRARPLGADGIVSGVAAAIPELLVALDRALVANAVPRIQELDALLQQFLDELEKFPATVAVKQAAVVRGWKLDNTAVPFDESLLDRLATFRNWFESWLPSVLADCKASHVT